MTSTTLGQAGPLTKQRPAVTLGTRLRDALRTRMEERRFERALRQASPGEHSDLLAASRRG